MLALGDGLFVGLVKLTSLLAIFLQSALVNEGHDRHLGCKLRYATHMIEMIVGHQQVINLLDTGRFRRRTDAVRIATVKTPPPGVHQHGLPRRRHDQRGLATFRIHEIHVEGLGCRKQRDRTQQNE